MILPRVPASYFGIALGIAGLGGSWRVAHRLWAVPAIVGELLMLLAAAVWLALLFLYAAKWFSARDEAVSELHHPVQCCFVGLIGVATSLVALAALPYASHLAAALAAAGGASTLAFGVWRTGQLWRGGRDHGATTAVLYLPLVAGMFVTAFTLAAFDQADWGRIAFGAGFFSWIAIESVLLQRLYTGEPLPAALRPTLGIQLAPPAVGAVALLSVYGGFAAPLAMPMVGYALLQALVLARMLPWIMEQRFTPSYWAFTFGATALSTAALKIEELGPTDAIAWVAPGAFGLANLCVAVVALASLNFAWRSARTSVAADRIDAGANVTRMAIVPARGSRFRSSDHD